MKASVLFLVFMVFAFTANAFAQTRTVTNRELTTYRTAREAAERELREDYARFGLPSPEERAKLNAREAKEMSELAARLRASRIASENARRVTRETMPNPPIQAIVVVESGVPVYYYPWQGGWYRYARPFGPFGPRQREGYYAGGQFWPTGPRTRERPIVRNPR